MKTALIGRVSRASPAVVMVVAVLGLTAMAALDHLTGSDLSFSVFYLAPISLVAWRTGLRGGVVFSVLGATVWFAVDVSGDGDYVNALIPVWNSIVRLAFFVIVCALIASVRRAMERETSLARTDPLTGLHNRRAFVDLTQREIERARRTEAPISFAYIDLDNFKDINDHFGHAAGDDVLRAVRRVFDQTMREMDITARLGGDEFAIVMPDTDEGAAAAAVDRLIAALGEAQVAASIGTVVFQSAPPSVDVALSIGDDVMYEAKANPDRHTAMRSVATDSTTRV